MTTIRKWRFPILIGMGLIAAGALVYFSNAHIGADKTQGAIGKRDVYRDSQVASADVATPGSAPVATEAILESSEFKSLAKNPDFQRLVTDANLAEAARNGLFSLLVDENLTSLSRDPEFVDFIKSDFFHNNIRRDIKREELLSTLRTMPKFEKLTTDPRFRRLLENAAALNALRDRGFASLIVSEHLQALFGLRDFQKLALNPAFERAVSNGSVARLTVGLEDKHGLENRLQDKDGKQSLEHGLQDKLSLEQKLREDKGGTQSLVQHPE